MPDLGIDVLLKGQNLIRLLAGLGTALQISIISVAISVPFGIVLGVLMTWSNPLIKVILRIYLEIVRIMPQMVLLFLVFFGTYQSILDGICRVKMHRLSYFRSGEPLR